MSTPDITLNAGAGGAIIRTDPTTSSEHFQMVKLAYGDTGTFNFVSTALPLPSLVTYSSTPVIASASSGLIQLTSAIALSSGIVTLSSVPTVTATAGTNPWSSAPGFNMPVVNASSGLTQIIPVTSSGVNLYTTSGINVVSASSGLIQVTGTVTVAYSSSPNVVSASSGLVQTLTSGPMTLSATGALIVSASSGVVQVLTSGTLIVAMTSGTVTLSSTPLVQSASSGVVQLAQVTSSGQSMFLVYTTGGSTATNLTTAASNLKSFMFYNSSVAAFAVKIYNTTGPTIGSTTGQVMVIVAPGSTGGGGANMSFEYPGPYSSNGWSIVPTLSINATSTDAPSTGHPLNITYQV